MRSLTAKKYFLLTKSAQVPYRNITRNKLLPTFNNYYCYINFNKQIVHYCIIFVSMYCFPHETSFKHVLN